MKIRLLFIIGGLGTGGKERQMVELIKQLPVKEYEICVVLKNIDSFFIADLNNVELVDLKIRRFGISGFLKILGAVRRFKPDIIHSWLELTSLYCGIIKLFSARNIVLIDGSIRNAKGINCRLCIKNFIRQCVNVLSTVIVSNSKAGIEAYQVQKYNHRIIYNGYDNNRIAQLKNKSVIIDKFCLSNKIIIGMVARFDSSKDWQTYLNAAKLMVENNDRLVFFAIGGGPDLNYYIGQYSAYKDKIIFTGNVDNVEDFVNVFDIAVLSSFSEGISNSIMEYMALKKPIIVSGLGGVNELIQHNQSGYVYEVGDVSSLIMLIDRVILNPVESELTAQRAYEFLNTNFSIEKMRSSYIKLYDSLVVKELSV